MNSADHFEALVNEHYEPLFRFAMSLTRAESDARDLTQHTFYVWATKGHQLRDITKVKTWLYTTLHRAFLEGRRRYVRFPHHELEEVAEQLPNFEPNTIHQSDVSLVLPALARVDKIYQAAVALYYLEDCSYKEISAILEIPLGTVKSRIARGIVQLREILLSEDSGASFPPGVADQPPAVSEKDDSSPDAPSSKSLLERVCDEWDFSSTQLMEPLGSS